MVKKVVLLLTLVVILLIFLALSLLKVSKPDFPNSIKTVTVAVEKAMKSGDSRLLGVMGIGLMVPGVPDYQKTFSKTVGVNIIPGTSDAISNENQKIFQENAYQYALLYNKILLEKLEKSWDR
jgi:hypothetical protein